MAAVKVPNCLHVPKLYEGETVTVSFENTGAEGYELEYVTDESFEDTLYGLTWRNISERNASWAEIYSYAYSWKDIGELSGSDRISIVSGTGLDCPGTDIGLLWNEIDTYENQWDYVDGIKTWDEIEGLYTTGLSWDSIDSKYISWVDIESSIWDWDSFELLAGDIEEHKGFGVPVPTEKYNMQFRVRAQDNNVFSEYLTGTREYIISKKSETIYLNAGEIFTAQIYGEHISNLSDIRFSVFYAPNSVTPIKQQEKSLKVSNDFGKGMVFYSKFEPIAQGIVVDENVFTISFVAQKTGYVFVYLETMKAK